MSDTIEATVHRHADDAFSDHEMTVKHENGIYRHLRFVKPGTWMYGFDIVTWPGHLFVGGDIESFTFARVNDMIPFFAHAEINPHYWSEKLVAPRGQESVKVYDERPEDADPDDPTPWQWDYHFLLTCFALVRGVAMYRG